MLFLHRIVLDNQMIKDITENITKKVRRLMIAGFLIFFDVEIFNIFKLSTIPKKYVQNRENKGCKIGKNKTNNRKSIIVGLDKVGDKFNFSNKYSNRGNKFIANVWGANDNGSVNIEGIKRIESTVYLLTCSLNIVFTST